MKESVLRSLYKALQGGVEGVTLQELLGFVQMKPVLLRGLAQGMSTAEAFHLVRRCQGEVSEALTHLVIEAVEALEREKALVTSDQAVIFITEVGRRPFLKEEDQ